MKSDRFGLHKPCPVSEEPRIVRLQLNVQERKDRGGKRCEDGHFVGMEVVSNGDPAAGEKETQALSDFGTPADDGVRSQYDPDNLFRLNNNVKPALNDRDHRVAPTRCRTGF